jgi:hypothetical protein
MKNYSHKNMEGYLSSSNKSEICIPIKNKRKSIEKKNKFSEKKSRQIWSIERKICEFKRNQRCTRLRQFTICHPAERK